ncbi:MAG TPA: CoA-binding protein [Terriglobales bacterium]|nr:CoA-binding protein [Terriglobales bacterium]
MQASLEAIQHFLAHKRIAMVGVSRDPKHFSAYLFRELSKRGFDVVPVNPHVKAIYDKACFARVQDVQPPVEAALLMTAAETTDVIVRDCDAAGVRLVWMYRANGQGAVSEKAIQFCWERGIQVVPGECPLMFLAGAGPIHRVHGWIRRITGRYPRSSIRQAA